MAQHGLPANGGLAGVLITLPLPAAAAAAARFSLRLICANCARDCHSGLNKQRSRAARIRWLALNCVTTIISYLPVELQSDFIFEQICMHEFQLFGVFNAAIPYFIDRFKCYATPQMAASIMLLTMYFMFFSEQTLWRHKRGRWWRDAPSVGSRWRQVVRRVRVPSPAVWIPAARSGAPKLSVVGSPRDARKDEQPSFLMGVRSPRWVTQPTATSLRERRSRRVTRVQPRPRIPHDIPRDGRLWTLSPNWNLKR